MTAEIVAVGTEILLGQIADTNSQYLGRVFAELGIRHTHRQTVGDNLGRVSAAIRAALDRADLVVTIGGLGPTEDDLTREAIARVIADPLVLDPELEARLRDVFAKRGIPWVESQLRQAMRPSCANPVENPNGSAPGLICSAGEKWVIALPGPRQEFVPMVDGPIREFLMSLRGDQVILSRVLKVCGVGESVVEDRVRSLLTSQNPTVAPLAHPGEVHLRLTASERTAESAMELIAPVEAGIRRILGEAVFGADEDTLESVTLDLLRRRGQTLAVAESCTGGMLGAALTSVAGSSDVFIGGVISYANEVKQGLLGVSGEILRTHGAVSRECAEQMALGSREVLGADWALSITGIAGPGGGSAEKPVGLVYIGLAGPSRCSLEEHMFRGIREFIRLRTVKAALTMLRREALRA